ncbi:hypothetical protein C8Q79DRAFT_1008308 [Trametes meyenii]|nr:hypothetical protein C8Q79DRAFT_1008308 [Trametes meyenii]
MPTLSDLPPPLLLAINDHLLALDRLPPSPPPPPPPDPSPHSPPSSASSSPSSSASQTLPSRPSSAFEGWTTVLALARTCRALHGPALDTLWHTLPGLGPLVYALPRDLWRARMSERTAPKRGAAGLKISWVLVFVRELEETDLIRLKHYAPRVRQVLLGDECIGIPPAARRPVCTSVFEAFAAHFPDGGLLPNLEVLHTQHEGIPTVHRALPMLFGLHLRVILDNITVPPPPELVQEGGPFTRMVELLQERAPELTVLQLGVRHRLPAVSALIPDALCGFANLVLVNLCPHALSWRALLHLASLSSLQALHTYLPSLTSEADAHFPSCMLGSPVYFPALHEIRLTHKGGLAPCTAVLNLIHSPHFHTVTIRSGTRRTPVGDVVSLFAALGTCPTASTILKLTIDVPGVLNNAEIPAFAFYPLLALRNLATFFLNIPTPLGVDDALLHAMAGAWPCVVHLHLGTTSPYAHHDAKNPLMRVTFEALVEFLRQSPQVRTLGLGFTMCAGSLCRALRKACPGRGAAPGQGQGQGRLRTLNVGYSQIEPEDVAGVAAVLSDVCPELQGIWCGWQHDYECESEDEDEPVRLSKNIPGDEDEDEDEDEAWLAGTAARTQWSRVKRYISTFVDIRQQERRWASGQGMKPVGSDDAGA